MKFKMLKATFAAMVLMASGFANAALIYSDETPITASGQSFSDSVTLSELYENVVLNFVAKGDFGSNSVVETISFSIDGVNLLVWTWDTPGITVVSNVVNFDVTLSGTISISQLLWSTLASDDVLNFVWQNSRAVNPYPTEGGSDFVSFSLTGDVVETPEPSTLAILAIGLIGLGARRFKK